MQCFAFRNNTDIEPDFFDKIQLDQLFKKYRMQMTLQKTTSDWIYSTK